MVKNKAANLAIGLLGFAGTVGLGHAGAETYSEAEALRDRDPNILEKTAHFIGDQLLVFDFVTGDKSASDGAAEKLILADLQFVFAGILYAVGGANTVALLKKPTRSNGGE